ncbi:MAG: hypothetical protein COA42_19180 [Alteromonadaceae bacterium]|nr:MAG: hypothetical protein COA42_19180 [Alteromonadaceae bacterium]
MERNIMISKGVRKTRQRLRAAATMATLLTASALSPAMDISTNELDFLGVEPGTSQQRIPY